MPIKTSLPRFRFGDLSKQQQESTITHLNIYDKVKLRYVHKTYHRRSPLSIVMNSRWSEFRCEFIGGQLALRWIGRSRHGMDKGIIVLLKPDVHLIWTYPYKGPAAALFKEPTWLARKKTTIDVFLNYRARSHARRMAKAFHKNTQIVRVFISAMNCACGAPRGRRGVDMTCLCQPNFSNIHALIDDRPFVEVLIWPHWFRREWRYTCEAIAQLIDNIPACHDARRLYAFTYFESFPQCDVCRITRDLFADVRPMVVRRIPGNWMFFTLTVHEASSKLWDTLNYPSMEILPTVLILGWDVERFIYSLDERPVSRSWLLIAQNYGTGAEAEEAVRIDALAAQFISEPLSLTRRGSDDSTLSPLLQQLNVDT